MTVVVGVDGSERSRVALQLAAQEAHWQSLLPGSVSQYVLLKAECPVMLVPSNGTGVTQSHHETAR